MRSDQGYAIRNSVEEKYPDIELKSQTTVDGMTTFWVDPSHIIRVLGLLKNHSSHPFPMLFDLTAVDERERENPTGAMPCLFSVVYHLFSPDRREFLRLKVALVDEYPHIPSATEVYPVANWYEREVWDMFGITFDGHPHLSRIVMPKWWRGHPLRKEHPARATELPDYVLTDALQDERMDQFTFNPDDWDMQRGGEDTDYLFLNMGPNHPGTHGLFRVVLQLDGEEIVDAVPEIGFHHRGAEKMAERQTWHSFIPYTDRIDYLGGSVNNMAYVQTVERLAGIDVPDRAKVMRIMLTELFRISSHLVWYGTFAQDLGALSPIFLMFIDREEVLDIVTAITGGRMHPSWFRIGGTAQDLPNGWEEKVRAFIKSFDKRLKEYTKMVMKNRIIRKRTQGVAAYNTQEAMEWGVTGPGLRATGYEFDFRKHMPYGGYDQFEFDIPTATHGDTYDRSMVRVEELRQSLRIIEQCVNNMPEGEYQSDHPLATPPRKKHTMKDIETLINHFVHVTWGPVIPPGEAMVATEATKGSNAYYLVSDGGVMSYRTRIRTPSFPHLQMIPYVIRGEFIADLIAYLGSIDFVMADVDR